MISSAEKKGGVAARLLAVTALLALLCALPVQAGGLPEPVDRALREAEAMADLQVSFTMMFKWADAPEITKRFDSVSGTWRLLSGDPTTLDRAGRAKLRNLKRLEARPGGLVAADYRPQIKQADLVSMDADALIYRFLSPYTAGLADNKVSKVQTRLRIDKLDGGLKKFAVRVDESFKPNPCVRIDRFHFEHDFERAFPDLPPLMTRVYSFSEGASVASTIGEEYSVQFTDFERTW